MDFDDLFGGSAGNDGILGDDAGDFFMFGGTEQGEYDELRDQKDSVIFLIDCHHSMFR